MKTQKCTNCHQEKTLDNFNMRKTGTRYSVCKSCSNKLVSLSRLNKRIVSFGEGVKSPKLDALIDKRDRLQKEVTFVESRVTKNILPDVITANCQPMWALVGTGDFTDYKFDYVEPTDDNDEDAYQV